MKIESVQFMVMSQVALLQIQYYITDMFSLSQLFLYRYLVASRDLKKGELLIEVDALVIGPCAESLPICLGCYVDLVIVPTQY